MIRAAANSYLIPSQKVSLRFFHLLFLCMFLSSLCTALVTSMEQEKRLTKKRSLAEGLCTVNKAHSLGLGMQHGSKKLRRLPHVFNRVLELPVKSDADVSVIISSGFIRFVVSVGRSGRVCNEGARVFARATQVYPGVVKVVVSGHGSDEDVLLMDGLVFDRWRYRLPVLTRPERTTAVCVDGDLVVSVPKQPTEVEGETLCGTEHLITIL